MNSENLPKTEQEQYDPNLEAQDEDVMSGGNNRLMYVLVAVVLALVVGYVALPKGGGSGMASVTPTFMLDDAAVTATAPTSADSIAAGLKTAPAATPEEEEEDAPKTAAKPVVAAKAPAAAPAAVAVTEAAPAPAPAPEPVAEAPAAAPEPAAPANVTMAGRILDENGRPLVGATVLVKGSSKGTSTDANGNYSIEVPGGEDHSLIFGYGGYDDEIVRVSGSKPVNVTLTPRAKASKKRR
ncbi:carboxypeptidase-like regulatory domain-containing protein [Hymenobacter humi]|uniref:Carboxypeptidase-like regulatory domain-containing protein n=1 Tax=Hymenobacter humi TaxID=1411620 RepID=A0ABW2U6J7_9BACT